MRLIKEWQLVRDDWAMLGREDQARIDLSPAGPKQILPLALYETFASELRGQGSRVGLLLEADADCAHFAKWLAQVSLLAIRFDRFTDGRGYSLARLIRQRHGFVGELRAVGDVLHDQLYFLHQCGFDAFLLRQDQDPHDAIKRASDYSWSPKF